MGCDAFSVKTLWLGGYQSSISIVEFELVVVHVTIYFDL